MSFSSGHVCAKAMLDYCKKHTRKSTVSMEREICEDICNEVFRLEAEIARLQEKWNHKKLSPEVTTMFQCEDCGAATRWGRHLDMDCKTIAEQRDEIARLRGAIEDAPHSQLCRQEYGESDAICDCWVSRALKVRK